MSAFDVMNAIPGGGLLKSIFGGGQQGMDPNVMKALMASLNPQQADDGDQGQDNEQQPDDMSAQLRKALQIPQPGGQMMG